MHRITETKYDSFLWY